VTVLGYWAITDKKVMDTWSDLGGADGADSVCVRMGICGVESDVWFSKEFVNGAITPIVRAVSEMCNRDRLGVALVGICGCPGSGKSVLANVLEKLCGTRVKSIGMDAFHFTNAKLHEINKRDVKGSPETIDVDAFVATLEALKQKSKKCPNISLPVYDRNIHDPIPNADEIGDQVKVVLVDGIHLFCDGPPWARVPALLDGWIFLTHTNPSLCFSRVIERKVANGVSREAAEMHYKRVDLPNCDKINAQIKKALSRADNWPKLVMQVVVRPSSVRTLLYGIPHHLGAACDPSNKPESLVVVLGPNPALQKTMLFDKPWERDHVNRASKLEISVGGKGQQFSVAAVHYLSSHLNFNVKIALHQFLGGSNGRQIESILSSRSIIQKTVQVSPQTRTCLTLLEKDSDSATELIEPSGTISNSEYNLFVQQVKTQVENREGTKCAIALCGTTPPGTELLYADCARLAANDENTIVMLDGYKGISQVLPFVNILKVNTDELRAISCDRDQDLKTEIQLPVVDFAYPLFKCYPSLNHICVTAGANKSFLFSRAANEEVLHYEYFIPSISPAEFANPIGAGDTVGAVTLTNFISCGNMITSFPIGLAAGCATCLHYGQTFDHDKLEEFLRKMTCTQVMVAKS